MLTTRGDQQWRTKAGCQATDLSLWDVPPMHGTELTMHEQRIICDNCPVLRECAADAALARDVGIIRAGVAIPLTGNGRYPAWHALERLAMHGDIERAREDARPRQ